MSAHAIRSIHRQELREAIAYELFAIDEFRFRVHLHRDDAVAQAAHLLGDRSPEGLPLIHYHLHAEGFRSGTDEVRRVLQETLRPLMFGAAFKIHDSIVEWLLRANGVAPRGRHWPFEDKRREFRTGNIPFPLEFPQVLRCPFAETYGKLIEARHDVVHRSGVRVMADGTMQFPAPSNATLTDGMQAAYVRAMSLSAHAFAGTRTLDAADKMLLESAFAELEPIHRVAGLQVREARRFLLTIRVATADVRSLAPIECIVNFDEVLETWRRLEMVHRGALLAGHVRITPEGASKGWRFAVEDLPTGTIVLREGDGAYDDRMESS